MFCLIAILMLACGQGVGEPGPYQVLRANRARSLADGFAAVVKAPLDASRRDELAGKYTKAGYAQLAALFRASSAVARGAPDVQAVAPSGRRWLCPETPRQREALESSVRAVADRYGLEGPEAALADAHHLLQDKGFSCALGVVWGSLALQAAPVTKGVSEEDQELAVRLVVTGVDEAGVSVWPATDASSAYEAVANYFLARGDRVSAYSALLCARQRIRDGRSSSSDSVTEQAERIERELQSIRPAVHQRRGR